MKGLDGMFADLRLLTINVLYCAIKDSLDFILLEGLRIVFLELGQDTESHNDSQPVEVVFIL